MTNLSERVKKAKGLRITKNSEPGVYYTFGSNDDTYKIKLSSDEKDIATPDGYLTVKVFRTNCNKLILNANKTDGEWCNCQGNSKHTVCYHALGAIWKSFKDVGKQVSFYETFRDADRALTFGGFLAKVENNRNTGAVWCVVREKPGTPEEREIKILTVEQNINLMRGSEEDEGID